MPNPYKAKKVENIINLYKKVQVTIVDANDNETTATQLQPLGEVTLERIDSQLSMTQMQINGFQAEKQDLQDKRAAVVRVL